VAGSLLMEPAQRGARMRKEVVIPSESQILSSFLLRPILSRIKYFLSFKCLLLL
jgi:hypothetical protein